MKIKVTLKAGAQDPGRNLQLTADATATIGDLATSIASAHEYDGPFPGRGDLTLRLMEGQGSTAIDPRVSVTEAGLSSGAVIEIAPAQQLVARDKRGVAAVLKVISGPDAGREFKLPFGSSDIGRAESCDVVLSDPSVSKQHARVNVGAGVDLIDRNSSNGVVVGGVQFARVTLGTGDVAELGDTQLTITQVQHGEGARHSADIAFVRSPRVLRRPVRRLIDAPQIPRRPEPVYWPWLMMAAPLVMLAVVYFATRNMPGMSNLMYIYMAMMPLMIVASTGDQLFQSRRKHQAEVADFHDELARFDADLHEAHRSDRELLELIHPRLSACVQSIERLDDLLWSRRPEHPEFLQVRIGTGDVEPIAEPGPLKSSGLPDLMKLTRDTAGKYAVLAQAALIADLRSHGGVGLCGARAALDGVARATAAQVAALHSPAELVMCCLTSPAASERWAWVEWLPHTNSPHSPLTVPHVSADPGAGSQLLEELEELVAVRQPVTSGGVATPRGPLEREEETSPIPPLPAILVIVDEPSVDQARLIALAERGPDVGVYVMWVATRKSGLPAACRTWFDVDDGQHPRAGLVRTGRTATPVTTESLDLDTSLRLARTLAPLVDAGVPIEDASDLPRSVPVLTILGREACDDPSVVRARWAENGSLIDRDGPLVPRDRPASLRAVVGHSGADAFSLDLRVQGPHALVGGTTGAGKSEFLQAWVLGMAHALSPDRVTFLFVDYKGGAAFARCTDLPHCVGLVTDLSPYLVRRALRSLRAELQHREHLLNKFGAKDLIELEKSGHPECPPSLIIVIDEFAALAGEVPEFVDGVVDVAQRGRSLGLHLVMATQRPAGVIKDNLRANTNLRVALRMADESDSADVLGSPMAGHFDPAIPGRAAAKTGPGRITQFQSAFPGSRTPEVPLAPPIEIVEFEFGVSRAWRLPERLTDAREIPQDIDRVVSTLCLAAEEAGVPPPRRPWLDELATTYSLERLRQRTDAELVLGVLDDPDRQDQRVEYFRPDVEGNILYVGAGGSGKSTALRSLAVAASITPKGGPVQVYALDFAGGALSSLEVMPHVGSVISGDDDERVARLIRQLGALIEERAMAFAAVRAASLPEYRQLADRRDEPRILLLVDGFAAFREGYEATSIRLPIYEAFLRLLVDGRAVGVHVAITGDRPNAVPTSVESAFQRRVVLRQADEDSYVSFGVPKDVLSPASPPGRALQMGQPQELQIAILGEQPNVAAQARAMEELAAELRAHGVSQAPSVGALPLIIRTGEIPLVLEGSPVLGLGDQELAPLTFPDTGVMVISGPKGSGRSNALLWMASAMRAAHPDITLCHLTTRKSPTSVLPIWDHAWVTTELDGEDLTTLRELVSAAAPADHPSVGFVIERVPEFIDSPMEDSLAELVQLAARHGHWVLGEGDATGWSTSNWTLLPEFKKGRTGLLLTPDEADGDLLQALLPRVKRSEFPPGRGYWVTDGVPAKVQVPLSE